MSNEKVFFWRLRFFFYQSTNISRALIIVLDFCKKFGKFHGELESKNCPENVPVRIAWPELSD